MKTTINIDEEVFNPAYLPYLQIEQRYQVYYGGAGSGKSVFCAQKVIYSVLNFDKCNVLVVRKVANTNRFSTFRQILEIINQWGLRRLFNISQSSLSITCINNGNKIIFLGLDDVEKIKSITSIVMIWIEQASETTEEDLKQLNLRLRGHYSCAFQILISFNPVTQNHWLKTFFFDKKRKDTTILKTTYLDNKFIDDNYKEQLDSLKEQDLNYYNIYCLGNWGQLGARIYENCVIEQLNVEEIIKTSQYVAIGQDWGYNDPSVSLLVSIKNKQIYILDQLYVKNVTRTNLMDLMKQKGFNKYLIYADSAQPATIIDYRNNGFNIQGANKKGVVSKINQIKSKRIHINNKCIETINQIQSYTWKLDTKTNKYLDQPISFNDHCMDALRYAINYDFQMNSFTSYTNW